MECNNFTKEQLLERIEELEILCGELLKEKEQEAKLDYAWTGNLGHWYWNIKTNAVTFNLMKATALGYDKSELPEPVPYQFFTDKLHPDDYQNTMDASLYWNWGRKWSAHNPSAPARRRRSRDARRNPPAHCPTHALMANNRCSWNSSRTAFCGHIFSHWNSCRRSRVHPANGRRSSRRCGAACAGFLGLSPAIRQLWE